jgi:hypothetical protein
MGGGATYGINDLGPGYTLIVGNFVTARTTAINRANRSTINSIGNYTISNVTAAVVY